MVGYSLMLLSALPVCIHAQGHKRSGHARTPVITAPTALSLVADEQLPKEFDWRNVNGRSFVTADVNQHIPNYCGACWIHGTVAMLNDRLKIQRGGAFPDAMLSRQTLLNCVEGHNNTAPPGCMGGEPQLIFDHMRRSATPDETCNIWKAVQDEKCEPKTICSNCDLPPGFLEILSKPNVDLKKAMKQFDFAAGCKAIESFIEYYVGDYGFIEGPSPTMETDMMKEIYANGPLVCGMDATDQFMLGYSDIAEQHEGVFMGVDMHNTDHDVEVAGWGETASGQKYWVARNSWGTYWGEGGWFKLARGINQNEIEMDCAWAKPYSKDLGPVLEGIVLGDYHRGIHSVKPASIAEATAASAASQPLLLSAVALASSFATVLASRLLQAGRPKAGKEPLLG